MRAASEYGLKSLARHSEWVASQLGAGIEACVVFDVEVPLRTLAVEHLSGGQLWRARAALGPGTDWPSLMAEIESIEFAEGTPLCSMSAVDTAQLEKRRWSGELRNSAFALRLRGLPCPVVVLAEEAVVPGPYDVTAEQHQWVAVRREHFPAVLRYFHNAITQGRKRVRVFGGQDYFLPSGTAQAYSWDDVMLDEARQSLVRRDFEHFLERREWFVARRVPWRRGYLFHGPPGNGKTSAVRAMASHPEVSAFSIDFVDKRVNDHEVSALFTTAADYSPSLILLEDVDRVFATKDQVLGEINCSFSHLLNCLDGLAGREGTVVVATANHPEHLDEAILRRPGRFDRVVHFPLPDAALRERYLTKLCPHLDGELGGLASKAERMSFAQLREVWLLACQEACLRDSDPALAELEAAWLQVKREQGAASKSKLGFEIPLDENPGEFSAVAATMKL
jgi:hypothetical protein